MANIKTAVRIIITTALSVYILVSIVKDHGDMLDKMIHKTLGAE